jgi:hypothetical protein
MRGGFWVVPECAVAVTGSSKAHRRISLNLVVFGHDRTLQDAGGRDQKLVDWISMERLGQLSGLHYDLRVECRRDTPGSARALSIHRPTSRSSFSLPYSTSLATSQQEMMLTPRTRSAPRSRRSRCFARSRSDRATHHTQMWVSSRITAGRPSPRRQQDRRAHGIRQPNLEGFGPRPPILRLSRPPVPQQLGQDQREDPPERVRHAHRR